jgi:hypothetical protein
MVFVFEEPSSGRWPPSPILRTGEGDNRFCLRPLSEAKWEKVPEGRMRALSLNPTKRKFFSQGFNQ